MKRFFEGIAKYKVIEVLTLIALLGGGILKYILIDQPNMQIIKETKTAVTAQVKASATKEYLDLFQNLLPEISIDKDGGNYTCLKDSCLVSFKLKNEGKYAISVTPTFLYIGNTKQEDRSRLEEKSNKLHEKYDDGYVFDKSQSHLPRSNQLHPGADSIYDVYYTRPSNAPHHVHVIFRADTDPSIVKISKKMLEDIDVQDIKVIYQSFLADRFPLPMTKPW